MEGGGTGEGVEGGRFRRGGGVEGATISGLK